MPHVNEQIDEKGVAFTQGNAVTAFFPRGCDEVRLTQSLDAAGVAAESVYIFTGQTGAERLNTHNSSGQSLWDRFWRAFEKGTADENFVLEKAGRMLRSGGTLVVVFTDDDIERQAKTIGVMKACGAEHLVRWGEWTFEELQ